MKSIYNKIETEVEYLGESIECMELDTDDFTSVYIKIEPSERVGKDFYIVGAGTSIKASLEDVLTGYNGIKGLIRKLEKSEIEFIDYIQEKREQKQWLESQM